MQVDSGIVGRGHELRIIEEQLAMVRAGTGGVLVVEGPAGIGKTTLLQAARRQAADEAMRVLSARGGDLERGFAFGLARQLFEPLLAGRAPARRRALLAGAAALAAEPLGLADAHAGSAPAPTDPAFAAYHGLYWLTAGLATEAPLVLALDDAHWGDVTSLRWLTYLARRVEELPVLVLLAWRTGEPDAAEGLLRDLLGEPATTALRPAPLSPEAVGVIVRERRPEADAVQLHEATGGNPFLLVELLRAPEADHAAQLDPGRLDLPAVTRTVTARLERLGPVAARLAAALAVLGDGAELRHVEGLSAVSRSDAVSGVDRLVAGVVLEPGRPLRFVHPLIRDVVLNSIPDHQRAEQHKRAARLLAAEGAVPGRVAIHLQAAAPAADPWTVDRLADAAAIALERGASAEGIALLERALREPPSSDRRARVLAQLGAAERHAGLAPAAAHLREAIALESDPVRRAPARRELASHLAVAGDAAGAAQTLAEGAAELGGVDDELGLHLDAMRLSLDLARQGACAPVAAGFDAHVAQLTGETAGERLLLGAASYRATLRGDRPAREAGDLAERALGGGRLVDDLGHDTPELAFVLMVLQSTERLQAAAAAGALALERARATGSIRGHQLNAVVRLRAALLTGELWDAEADAEIGLESLGEDDLAHGLSGASFVARCLTERGRLDDAEALLAAAGRNPTRQQVGTNTLRGAIADLHLARGRWREAADTALAIGADLPGAARYPALPWRATAAVALAALGERDRATALAAEQLENAWIWDTPRAIGTALWAQGHAAGGEAGIALLQRAAAVLTDSPTKLMTARALVDLGAALRRAGRRVDARDALRSGLDLAQRCGALLIAERAHEELLSSGARLRRPTLSGADALTPSEHRVAQLAATGLSNPEIAQSLFVTRKTVEAHLGAVFRKLDIGSRRDLPAALGLREPSDAVASHTPRPRTA